MDFRTLDDLARFRAGGRWKNDRNGERKN